MMRRLGVSVLFAVSFLFAATGDAIGQSALITRGLGLPVEPLDGRSRGLGGVGIGLPDGELSWLSPAGLYGLPAPAIVATYQFDSFSTTSGDANFDGNTGRFPYVLTAIPAGSHVVLFAGYGTLFDQTWRLEHPDTLIIAGDSIPVLDENSSNGGVTKIRFGTTLSPFEGLGVSIAVDLLTGSVSRVLGRSFGDQTSPPCCRSAWTYSGTGYSTGVHWAPSAATGIAASVTVGGTLDATPPDTFGGAARSYELPVQARVGASARVGQTTLVALSGGWDGWSSLNDALASEGGSRDSWSVQGGIEWDGANVLGRPLPLRVGGRTATLPFRWGPEAVGDWAGERALTLGAGMVLAGGTVRPDVAFERGSRGGDASGVDESYWRMSFSMRVLGR